MTNVPFVTSDWRRDSAQEPVLKFKNRYFEVNPTNFEKGSAVILRPGFRRFTLLDTSSVKSMYASQGLFHDFIFALTADGNIKVAPGGTSEQGLAIASAVPHNNQGTFTDQVGSITNISFQLMNILFM